MKFISYSQNFEDIILWRALKHIKNGTYIDVGANDPVKHSVTKAFYDRGWRGVNIEPVEYWLNKLKLCRPEDINLGIAASNISGQFNFYELEDTGLSTFDLSIAQKHQEAGHRYKLTQVETKTLTQICIESKVSNIHFLKIDVEGHEKQVLEGLDFQLFRPWIILIESNIPLEGYKQNYAEWNEILINNGYKFVYYDGLNRFYLTEDKIVLEDKLAIPPNIFDNFIQYDYWLSQSQIEIRLNNVLNSFSWRSTYFLRFLSRPIRKLLNLKF